MNGPNTFGKVQGESASSGKAASAADPPLSELDALQLLLDLGGMVPGAGAIADLLNAAISAARGDWLGMALSIFSAAPAVGDAAALAKIAKNGPKYVEALAVVEAKVLPKLPDRLAKPLKEFIEKAKAKLSDASPSKAEPKPKSEPDAKPAAEKGKGDSQVKGSGRDCRLRKYKEGCAGGKTPHHVVPDRVFRMPGSAGENFPGGLSHADGFTVCVDGGTPVRRGPRANEHGLIHAIYDPLEAALGAKGNPTGTASLLELEMLGVAAASKVTGCNAVRMAAELRAHHQAQGLSPTTTFRADPTGNLVRGLNPKMIGKGTTSGGMGGI